ncbi:hypothetical protein DFH06DRAFT_1472068 [Mycena polygramma]|nr:hypothetical protein DFH06DRAFT_1472068 [Mycena polygramma]
MSTSPSLSVDLPAREQCLRNSDLIREILGHISESSRSDRDNLKAERRSFLSVASTCKAMSPSAIRFLWRSLDNLMPLLHLLPAFGARNGISALFGPIEPPQWESFDRHAVYVQEIVHQDVAKGVEIDPSVYLQLVLHKAPPLPNVRRFVCSASVHPSASEILVYMQSPLQAIELGSADLMAAVRGAASMDRTREIITSTLSAKPNHISSLIIVRQPFSIADTAGLEQLTSLELSHIRGGMDIALFQRLGSLPHLRAFAAGSECFSHQLRLHLIRHPRRMAPHLVPIPPQSLFMELTDLHLRGLIAAIHWLLPDFLQTIGTIKLQSLILEDTQPSRGVQFNPHGLARHWGTQGAKDEPRKLRGAFHIIAKRWSRTLHRLDLAVDDEGRDIAHFLRRFTSLRSLKLSGCMRGVLESKDFSYIFNGSGLANLETLSFLCWFHRDSQTRKRSRLQPSAIRGLVQSCPKLRHLDVAIAVQDLPPPSLIPPIPRAGLKEISIRPTNKILDTVAFARYIDHVLPGLSMFRYDTTNGGGTEAEAAWSLVQKLIFTFQDVRRDALRNS